MKNRVAIAGSGKHRRLSSKTRREVEERDGGVCAICGLDTKKVLRIIRSALTHYADLEGNLWWEGGTDVLEAIGWIPDLQRKPFDIDHLQPVALGGKDEATNLQTLCQPCHWARSARLHREVTGLPEATHLSTNVRRQKRRLISRFRLLDEKRVRVKMQLPQSELVVRVLSVRLRGRPYRVVLQGHHALDAARRRRIEPIWRGPTLQFQEFLRNRDVKSVEYFFLFIFGHSGWYFVDTGLIVRRLLLTE